LELPEASAFLPFRVGLFSVCCLLWSAVALPSLKLKAAQLGLQYCYYSRDRRPAEWGSTLIFLNGNFSPLHIRFGS
jgi:hypothetical protein